MILKALFIVLLLTIVFYNAYGQTTEDRRRIEEEKRQTLSVSETRAESEKPTLTQDSLEPQYTYLENLLAKDRATIADIYAILTILTGYDDRYDDFSSQADFLEKNKIIPHATIGSPRNPDKMLKKGEMAYMFCKILKIKGGLWLRIFGINNRYALKELVYENVMLPGAISEFVSGGELVYTATQAALFLTEQKKAGNWNPEKK